MRGFLGSIGLTAAGAAAGAFSAYLAIQGAGVEATSTGSPWLSRAAALQGSSGFYVRLHYLLEGRLPPAQGQIAEATAETDGEGGPLNSGCRYRLASTGPLPRWWSIAAEGVGSDPLSRQTVADSDMVVREADGTVRLVASLGPQPGNWLKLPDARRFTLLYSAIPASGQRVSTAPPFSITREGC